MRLLDDAFLSLLTMSSLEEPKHGDTTGASTDQDKLSPDPTQGVGDS